MNFKNPVSSVFFRRPPRRLRERPLGLTTTHDRSFTLVEVLIAVAITSLLLGFFTVMIDSVQKGIERHSKRMNSNAQARLVFERLGEDLRQMPIRRDMGYHMDNTESEEDFLRFVSRVPGPGGDRRVSLVAYKLVKEHDGSYGLYRGVRGYSWNDYGFMGLDEQGNPPRLLGLSPEISLSPESYDLLSPSVFRVALTFQRKSDGELSKNPPLFNSSTQSLSTASIQITNIGSVVVTLAVLDAKKPNLPKPEEVESIRSLLELPPEGRLPSSVWNKALTNRSPSSTNLPKGVVHIYERFYPLD